MPNIDYSKPIEIAEGVFWVGYFDPQNKFRCNPYVIIDNDEAVIIDCGGANQFSFISQKVFFLINHKKITAIVIHHQDPDVASNISLFEMYVNKPDLKILMSQWTSLFASFYGISSPINFVNIKKEFTFTSGRKLTFIATPYCHSPGAVMTYDTKTKTLFSSDVWGSYHENWQLEAPDDYGKQIEMFHQIYMSSNSALINTMSKIEKLDLDLIAPQHGSIIRKDKIPEMINFLKKLKVGVDLQTSKTEEFNL